MYICEQSLRNHNSLDYSDIGCIVYVYLRTVIAQSQFPRLFCYWMYSVCVFANSRCIIAISYTTRLLGLPQHMHACLQETVAQLQFPRPLWCWGGGGGGWRQVHVYFGNCNSLDHSAIGAAPESAFIFASVRCAIGISLTNKSMYIS